jgi:prolyl-tRNA synthetase
MRYGGRTAHAKEPLVILRLSSLFFSTLREDPADAEVPSHKLLVRGGYIRRCAPGIYSWLPLGWRVHEKVEQIVREEMDRIAQEIHLPALLPREPYELSHRWTDYGDDIFRLKDRRGNDMLLGPTHEEIFTLLVKDICSSYRDYPLSLYQIQWKYRDEARPRAGVLRGREFLMKDSYSFDLDDEGLAASYAAHRATYMRIFDRLGLGYVPVHAHSGAMGGSASEEFLSPADVGEDSFATCANCGYAANSEAVGVHEDEPADVDGAPPAQVVDTPGTATIDTVVAFLEEHLPRGDRPWGPADTLKNLAVVVRSPEGEESPLLVGVPGDREVDPRRLEAQLFPSTFRPMSEDDFAARPELVKGYIGPGVPGVRYLLDAGVRTGSRWVTGANQPDRHVVGLVVGRDFEPDGRILAAELRDGDPCPNCRSPLQLQRGIELGHIFALGRKFAEALGLSATDQEGKQVTITMGSYGIGISRMVAVLVENHHDEAGIMWPRAVAPADVHVLVAGKSDEAEAAAERLAEECSELGLTVMLDDRPGLSAGERFSDADLLGVPTIVVCGRGVAHGVVEVKDRASGSRTEIPLDGAAASLAAVVAGGA